MAAQGLAVSKDPRIDAYIEAAAGFARPILLHFRAQVSASVPDVAETIKWGMPFFEYRDRQVAMMAAFKAHAGAAIFDGTPMSGGVGMGQFGKLTEIGQLPDAPVLAQLLRRAVALVDTGVKPAHVVTKKPSLPMPADLRAALDTVPAAAAAFDGFPPSAQREYIEWALEAKQEATRARRIATTVLQCAEGKRRYWNMAGR
jgi:uncharacterized protein YdeI (YjbR/CyaY-like superfamily)